MVEQLVNQEIAKQQRTANSKLVAESVFYDAFIEPFVDVAKTARHGLQSSVQSIVGNTRKIAMQTAVAMMPFVAASEVTRIGKDEAARLKQKLASLDSEYADVLERNIHAIHAGNAATLMFLMNPAKALGEYAAMWAGGKAVSLGSDVAVNVLDFLEILTSSVPGISKKVGNLKEKFSSLSGKASSFADSAIGAGHGGHGSSGGHSSGEDYGSEGYGYADYADFGEAKKHNGNLILEQPQVNQQQQAYVQLGKILQGLLANKNVLSAINSSKVTRDLVNTAIETVLGRANKVAGLQTVDQVKAFMGSEFDKVYPKIKNQIPKNTPEEQLKQFESELVSEIKKSYKKVFQNYLSQILSGVTVTPQDNQKINSVLSKLG